MRKTERELLAEISTENLMSYTEKISQKIRISGSREERESLEYIQKKLEDFGYETKLLEYVGYISYPVSASVTIEEPKQEGVEALGCCFTPSSKFGGIVGEVVEGTEKDQCGKIVLFDGLASARKIASAKQKGAVGVIFVQDDNLHNCPASDIWGCPEAEQLEKLPKLPAVSITRPASEKIRELLRTQPVIVRLESTMVNEWKRCPILTADLQSDKSDKFVLFSGHIDSWYYGAMDNGSANATMMECARVLAKEQKNLRRGIRIAFWSGHSQGKYAGSSWYADHYFEELEEKCIAHVNIDSVGGKDAVIVEEPPVMAQAWDLAGAVIEEQTGRKFKGKRIARNADQSFLGVGITSIFGTFSEQDIETVGDTVSFRYGKNSRAGGLGWWWHTKDDTIDKIDPQFLLRDCKIYLAVLWRLLVLPILPYSLERAVEEAAETIEKLQSKLETVFDFSLLEERLGILLDKTVNLDQECRKTLESPETPERELTRLTELQLQVCRCIVRMAYHENSIFQFDMSGKLYPLPNLEIGEKLAVSLPGSSCYYLYLNQLQRGYNRVMAYVKYMLELLS